MPRATTSFPVPVSPRTSTGVRVAATDAMTFEISIICGSQPTRRCSSYGSAASLARRRTFRRSARSRTQRASTSSI